MSAGCFSLWRDFNELFGSSVSSCQSIVRSAGLLVICCDPSLSAGAGGCAWMTPLPRRCWTTP